MDAVFFLIKKRHDCHRILTAQIESFPSSVVGGTRQVCWATCNLATPNKIKKLIFLMTIFKNIFIYFKKIKIIYISVLYM